MDRTTFDDGMSWLQKIYGDNFEAHRIEEHWTELQDYDDIVVAGVLSKITPETHREMPTPTELRGMVEAAKRNAMSPPKNRHAKDATDLMLRHSRRPMTEAARREYLQEMRDMHEKYPNAGWLEAEAEMRRWYSGKGLIDSAEPKSERGVEPEIEFIEPDEKNE